MAKWINTGNETTTPQQHRRVVPTVTPTSNQYHLLETTDNNDKLNLPHYQSQYLLSIQLIAK